MKKAMEDFYDPLVKKQNERIAELEDEVKTLRREKAEERAEHQKQIDSLQKQITELYRALGIRTVRQVRNGKGQFTSETVEEPLNED
jgi:vacuolar-type H+-ATPase subunit I/STV1